MKFGKSKQAKRQDLSAEAIHSIAKQFLSLLRSHSKLKRAAQVLGKVRDARNAKQQCYKNLHKYARKILDANSTANICPSFSEREGNRFFQEVYDTEPCKYIQPDWMPTPQPPRVPMDCGLFTCSEIQKVIKKTKAISAPCPFDRVGYQVFKKCPALIPALVDLFNSCWALSDIPPQWKAAAIKLIAKESAAEDSSNPGNFRPIALTSCLGKLFTTLL